MKDRSANMAKRQPLYDMGHLHNLKELIDRACIAFGNTESILEIKNKQIVAHKYFDIKDDINALGTAFLDMGFDNKHIALVGESSYRWIITDIAVTAGAGILTPLDKELTPPGLAYIINRCDAEVVICSKAYMDAIASIKQDCEKVKTYILLDAPAQNGFLSLDDILEKGRKLLAEGNTLYWDREPDTEAVCAILFTSGTTGPNKGVMLSQKNICKNVDNVTYVIPGDTHCLAMLPMHHAFEFNCNILTNIYLGVKLCLVSSLKDLVRDMHIYQPDECIVVPMFTEMVYKAIWDHAKAAGKTEELRAKLLKSKELLSKGIDNTDEIFAEQRALFGGKLREIICGGAPLNPKIAEQLNLMGFDIFNGYGITECSPIVSINMHTDKDPYTVGVPMPDTSVKIADANEDGIGEILVRGDIVMQGYYKDEEATKASFDSDGYFKTGDYGKLTEDGRLHITGRKKNLIILANGKNVHPEEIEQAVSLRIPQARECVVYAAKNETHAGKTDMINLAVYIEDLTEDIKSGVISELKALNQELPVFKRIGCVVFKNEKFEKTTTNKIVRQKVIDSHDSKAGIIL